MSKNYFTQSTEQAILDFLTATGITRTRLYNTSIHPAINTMTDSIIKRYFYFDDQDEFNEIKTSAIFTLIKNLHKFDPSRARAFAFCQTVIKNHCIDYFTRKKRLNDKYLVVADDELIENYDLAEEEQIDSFNDIFNFIDYATTGNTQLNAPLIIELKKIKESCFNGVRLEYNPNKITQFYNKLYSNRSLAWREMKLLRFEYRRFLKKKTK